MRIVGIEITSMLRNIEDWYYMYGGTFYIGEFSKNIAGNTNCVLTSLIQNEIKRRPIKETPNKDKEK